MSSNRLSLPPPAEVGEMGVEGGKRERTGVGLRKGKEDSELPTVAGGGGEIFQGDS